MLSFGNKVVHVIMKLFEILYTHLILSKFGGIGQVHLLGFGWVVNGGQSQAPQGVASGTILPGDVEDLVHQGGSHRYLSVSKTNVAAPVQYTFGSTLSEKNIGMFCHTDEIVTKIKPKFLDQSFFFFIWNHDLTLMNIFGPDPNRETLVGTQYELMDFLSLENSRVNSFFHMLWIPWLTTKAESRRDLPVLSKFHGFNFSASTVKAVSVASPTFSKACLYCLKRNKRQSMRIINNGHQW